MSIQKDVPLSKHSTMRLGGTAKFMQEVASNQELAGALAWAKANNLPAIIIGLGSNIIWADQGFNGLVIVNKILGFEKLDEDEASATYAIGAGEEWDSVVDRLTDLGLSGVECLSLIPGKAGATPVQNVGAYGQEIAQTLQSVEAYDNTAGKFVDLSKADCEFGYRMSCFKSSAKGRYFITKITLKLSKSNLKPPFYASLKAYLDEHNIKNYEPRILRQAVIAIRKDKMPDWHKIANNGSFFANPIIDADSYNSLKSKFPSVAGWPYEGKYKISAGWLLENAGFKGYHDPETGMATSDKTALVLINENARSTADLIKFKQKIVDKIYEQYGIKLEQEPELIT